MKRNKTIKYYIQQLFLLTRYRGLTLEALFRCIAINNVVEIVVLKKFLISFLVPSDDLSTASELNTEVNRMVAYIASAFDLNLTGFIDRNHFIGLL